MLKQLELLQTIIRNEKAKIRFSKPQNESEQFIFTILNSELDKSITSIYSLKDLYGQQCPNFLVLKPTILELLYQSLEKVINLDCFTITWDILTDIIEEDDLVVQITLTYLRNIEKYCKASSPSLELLQLLIFIFKSLQSKTPSVL